MRRKGCCFSHQEACVRAQVTLHTSPPRSLCSPPLPGSRDPGTTSPGERTACLGLVQCHAGLCRHRLAPHPYPSLPPAGVSQSPRSSGSFNPILCERRTDALRQPTHRGGAKSKTEPPGAVRTKKRRGNLSQQPQKRQIKSP